MKHAYLAILALTASTFGCAPAAAMHEPSDQAGTVAAQGQLRRVEPGLRTVAQSWLMLLNMSHAVAVVKVRSIGRQSHTPYDSTGPDQHTMFECEVLDTWMTPAEYWGPTIKVWQSGGNLAWQEGGESGVGMRIVNQPLLRVDKTYVLFLESPVLRHPQFKAQGVMRGGDPEGTAGGLDEFRIASIPRGMWEVWADDTLNLPSELGGERVPVWRFSDVQPATITGMTLGEAKQVVLNEIAKRPRTYLAPARLAELKRQELMKPTVIPPIYPWTD